MPLIEVETLINAPIERVFDLARSIDAHITTTEGTRERAVGGRRTGLIEAGETVTWEARHFGVTQRLSVRITDFERPFQFRDVMTRGAFATMDHIHYFSPIANGTRMKDVLYFTAPLGILGRIAEHLVLTKYMREFLRRRGHALQKIAESEEWRRYLP